MKDRFAVQPRTSATFAARLGQRIGREVSVMNTIIHTAIQGAPLVGRPRADSEGDRHADRIARYEGVLSWIEDLIEQTAVSNEQWALLEPAAVGLQQGISSVALSGDCIPSIELPLAVLPQSRARKTVQSNWPPHARWCA
jgi:hypothetical protein